MEIDTYHKRIVHLIQPQTCYRYQYVILPDHLMKKKSLTCFVNNKKGIPFNDNLCMFRSLMFHKYKHYDIEQQVKEALEQWTHGTISKKDFSGVKLEELPKF